MAYGNFKKKKRVVLLIIYLLSTGLQKSVRIRTSEWAVAWDLIEVQ